MERTYEVDCYFPMRRDCHVTLYQVKLSQKKNFKNKQLKF